MRIVKNEEPSKVAKKSSPPKKMLLNKVGSAKKPISSNLKYYESLNQKPVYFKEMEQLNKDVQKNTGSEVKSLKSFYEGLSSSSSTPLSASSTTTPRPLIPATTSSGNLIVKKKKVSRGSTGSNSSNGSTTSTKNTTTTNNSNTTTTQEVGSAQSTPSTANTPVFPQSPKQSNNTLSTSQSATDMTMAIRESFEVYRSKITELEMKLEREIRENKSLKQELLMLNERSQEEQKELFDLNEEHERTIQRLQDEVHEAEEYCYNLRAENSQQVSLVSQYKSELFDCQTLVTYYQEEFGKKCADVNDLNKKLNNKNDEIKQYKLKIQQYLELEIERENILKSSTLLSTSMLNTSTNLNNTSSSSSSSSLPKTPTRKDSNNSIMMPLGNHSTNQQPSTPGSTKKKLNLSHTNNSMNTSGFKSPLTPLSKSTTNRTPKKVLSSPRSMLEYI